MIGWCIIAGSRTFRDQRFVSSRLDELFKDEKPTAVLSGCAAGPDTMGERWAIDHRIPRKRFPANWSAHGMAAGPIRNRLMAAHADTLVAFWDGQSRGTQHMIQVAEQMNLRVHIIRV